MLRAMKTLADGGVANVRKCNQREKELNSSKQSKMRKAINKAGNEAIKTVLYFYHHNVYVMTNL